MENPALIGSSLSNVTVIMVNMNVLMVELLYQEVTGHVPALKCQLPSAHWSQWLHVVLSSIKWPCYLRTPALGSLARYWKPRAWLLGS
jgi:hypothetical protein